MLRGQVSRRELTNLRTYKGTVSRLVERVSKIRQVLDKHKSCIVLPPPLIRWSETAFNKPGLLASYNMITSVFPNIERDTAALVKKAQKSRARACGFAMLSCFAGD